MARRDENECAYCAEMMERETRCVGRDWKVYCSPACREAGETYSAQEEAQRQIPITLRHSDHTTVSYLLT